MQRLTQKLLKSRTKLVRWTSAYSPFSKDEFNIIFDRNAKKLQRDGARRHPENKDTDYLKDEVAERLVDRLLDIKRRFDKIVDLGSGAGHLIKHLDQDLTQEVLQTDQSEEMLFRDVSTPYEVQVSRMVVDEELLPFEKNSEECIMSNLSLHWVNDLLGTFCQVNDALKPDGVFIASILGGDTLFELRSSLQLAEMERLGGISPHISPMADARDMGSLMNRAGFNLITVDVDEIVINYPSIFELMDDLRAMGEGNAILSRKGYLRRDVVAAASAIYQDLYGTEDGAVPATFQVFYVVRFPPTKKSA
jgi:NADH dehydrogenase [ubiquinone] 1 alpha subcomplex assembly factor 5